MEPKKCKAYRITTILNDEGSFGVYSAETPARAKTMVVSAMREAYSDANYPWITSCRRAPEYDALAEKYRGCIAWKEGFEHWEQDRGHWWDGEKIPHLSPSDPPEVG
jgi:hypothetical protein